MKKQRLLKLAGILTEVQYAYKLPPEIVKQLAAVPFPDGLDEEAFYDWDDLHGHGGVNTVTVIVNGRPFLVTTKDRIQRQEQLLRVAQKSYSS